MTRYLMVLGLVVAAATAMTALSTSTAGADTEETLQGHFISEIPEEETVKIDGEQIGAHTFTVGSFPAATCASVQFNSKGTTSGPAPTQVSISPVYETCHVVIIGITRTVTVTMNGCTYQVEATGKITESGEQDLVGDFGIACPEGKKIEVHVYNTSSSKDSEASTLCTFDIEPQSGLSGVTFEDKYNEVTDDFIIRLNIEGIKVSRTTGSEGLCGAASQTAVYKGEATMRGTNGASEYVATEVGAKKSFSLFNATTVKGENGTAKITTEAGPIECTSVKYEGKPAAVPRPDDLTLTPTYKDCKFDKLTANVEFDTCTYTQTLYDGFVATYKGKVFTDRHTTGPMEISCKDKPMTIKVVNGGGGVECTFTFASQAPEGVVDLTNKGVGDKKTIVFTHTLTKVAYEANGDEKTCGKNGVKLTDGKLEGELEVKAFSGATQGSWQVVGLDAPKKCPA